jgi:hypothetical protein
MHFVFPLLAALLLISGKVATKPQDITNDRFRIEDFSKNAPELVVDCNFWNTSLDPNHLSPPLVIRGVQTRYGRFFPYITLAVDPTENGPWTAVQPKLPQGRNASVTVPPELRVAPLKVDVTPFLARFRCMRWGKIELPSGDAITLELKEVHDAWNISKT